MGRKIFVSYKYADSLVKSLSNDFFVRTTARHYVDELQRLLSDDDHIYKGENDNESLSDFKDSTIYSKLRGKIFDSSITIVMISKGMKENYKLEKDQWIPWEISYSLRELTKGGNKSKTNAILAVILPDKNGLYDYFLTYDSECNCTNYNTPFLFNILNKNMFNKKNPDTTHCNGKAVFNGYFSYAHCVKWDIFKHEISKHIEIAFEIKENKDDYEIKKKIE